MSRTLMLMLLLLLTACTSAERRPDAATTELNPDMERAPLRGAQLQDNAIHAANAVTLYTFDVGQGLCQLAVYPAAQGQRPNAVLIDCGSTKAPYGSDMNQVAADIRVYLNQVNLLGVVVSHMDRDHCNLIPAVLPAAQGLLVILGEDPTRVACTLDFSNWLPQQAWQTLNANAFNPANAPFANLTANNVNFFFMGGGWDPNVPVGNGHSLVTGLHYQNGKIILTGDMTGGIADTIRGRYQPAFLANTAVMGVPHHGGVVPQNEVASIQAWVAATTPGTITFSSAYTSGNSHPRCDTANLYNPSLGQVGAHLFSCSNGQNNYNTQQTTARALGTCNLGLITTTVSANNAIGITSNANIACQD